MKLMLQLALAAVRPLTLIETNTALNVSEQGQCPREEDLQLQEESEFTVWVYKTCHFFLYVSNGQVDFIHQTAKDFLLNPSEEISGRIPDWFCRFDAQSCQQSMAETCLAYLCSPFVRGAISISFDEYCDMSMNCRLQYQRSLTETLAFGR
jgi:hypothetical protein